jgi:hypothetical protein
MDFEFNNEYGNCWQDLERRIAVEDMLANAEMAKWGHDDKSRHTTRNSQGYEPCHIGREEVETRMKGTNGVNKNTKRNLAATKEPTGEEMRKQIVERNVLRESKKVKQEGKKMVKRGKIKTLDSYFKKKLLVLK